MKKLVAGFAIALLAGAGVVIALAVDFSCGDQAGAMAGSIDENKQAVGGPCKYKSHAGICHITELRKGKPSYFTFLGKVSNRNEQFEKNETDGPFNLNDEIPCSVKFITSGTCTPCVFDLKGAWGSCGEAAWDYFRNRGN